ncbi:MAG: M15 family metallopeptidase [Actinoplanes sp.]
MLRRGAALSLFLASLVAAPTPVSAAPAAFVDVAKADPTILHDIRYATAHNFVGRAIRGYQAPKCLLSRRAATALTKVQSAVRKHGYSLKVYDCYRPRRAVSDFADWAGDRADTRMRREFYPRVDKATLFDDGYLAHRSGHSRGSTVDLTLVRLPAAPTRAYVPGESLAPCYAPASRRFPDNSLDMGTGYDCFDTLASTLDPRVRGKARANRLLLRTVMTRGGFTNYSHEWWHYTLDDEPYPSTYFNFPVA